MQQVKINRLNELDYRTNESYKTLRTNIQFAGESVKVIAVTSCTPGEGKTSTAMNLAVSLTEIGKNVLFIDADMRKSVFIRRYRISEIENGLSHYLSGQCEASEIIGDTNINSLTIISSGPVAPNPSELLSGTRFKALIEDMRKAYDYIIIDSPPLGSVIDAAIIAKQCDGAVLVIAANEVSYKFAQKVKRQLEAADCKVLGAILNKVDIKVNGYYGKYYYKKYYGSYYGDYGKKKKHSFTHKLKKLLCRKF